MPRDPFLYSHQIGTRLFSIGGKLVPISIRDQMIRGQLFVERAIEAGLIRVKGDLPLLVIGAGAGGVTAAMWAAHCSVPVVLVEQESKTFHRQEGCATRWIDPTQYDWPVNHWQDGTYLQTASGRPVMLPWSANYADKLVATWRGCLHNIKKKHFRIRYNTSLVKRPVWDRTTHSYTVSFANTRTGRKTTATAAALLVAMGFGDEKNSIDPSHASRGIAFWSNDPFGQPRLGVRGKASVLVSGAGDGALQDFLRIATADMPVGRLYSSCGIPPGLESRIHSAEQRANRAYQWGCNKTHDHPVLNTMQNELEACVKKAMSLAGVVANLRGLLRDPLPEIRLVYKCSHFSHGYALNQFLALLLARFIEEKKRTKVLFPNRGVFQIDSMSHRHTCCGKAVDEPGACHGIEHEVLLRDYPDCRKENGWGGNPESFSANVLVIRHGIQLSKLGRSSSPPHPRHLLRFHLS